MSSDTAIPYDVAAELCAAIRAENKNKWYSFNAWWCWGCTRASRDAPEKRCFAATPDCRGCSQVNSRYGKENS